MTDEPVAVSPVVPPPSIQRYQNPNIITTEVDTKIQVFRMMFQLQYYPMQILLKTSNPQTDELQQKLEDLKGNKFKQKFRHQHQ